MAWDAKEGFSDNAGHNILRLLDVLPNFPFNTVKRIVVISNKQVPERLKT